MLFEKGIKKVQKQPQIILFCNIIYNQTPSIPKMVFQLLYLS